MHARLITIITIIATLAVFRLLPHPPNVSPVAAMALFGGVYFSDKRVAFIVPFVALLLSDLFIGLHNSMLFVYAGFALTVMAGMWCQKNRGVTRLMLATVGASFVFFLLTNLGAWLTSGLYARTPDGLMQAYVAGIPFFQNSLLGNLVFVTIIFGGFAVLQKYITALSDVHIIRNQKLNSTRR